MCRKFTADELGSMDHDAKNDIIYHMQERLDRLEHDYENLIEQIRLSNQQRFGRHTENWMALPASCLFSMRQKHAVMHKVRNRLLMKLPAAL